MEDCVEDEKIVFGPSCPTGASLARSPIVFPVLLDCRDVLMKPMMFVGIGPGVFNLHQSNINNGRITIMATVRTMLSEGQ